MARNKQQRLTAIASGGLLIATLHACGTGPKPGAGPRPGELISPRGVALTSQTYQREAAGGGYVTVEVGVLSGPLPDLNMVGRPETVAWFSNEGEGGKREKRYDLKPRAEAEYDLVLSNDGSGRTKWTMNEVDRRTLSRRVHRSGHLWLCDPDDHSAKDRAVAFKDCPRPVRYDPLELTVVIPTGPGRFASYAKGDEAEFSLENAPIWISCTSGCCSLGR